MRVSYAVTARTSALYVATASPDSQVTSAELVANQVTSLKGICREKITNLKSWAVYFLMCRENASSEQGKYTASERVQISDARCGRARLVAFLGVRNHQPIASRIFSRLDSSCSVRAVSVWRPDLSGRSTVASRHALPPNPVDPVRFEPFSIASALDVRGLGHEETQKPGVSLQRARFFDTPGARLQDQGLGEEPDATTRFHRSD